LITTESAFSMAERREPERKHCYQRGLHQAWREEENLQTQRVQQ
jgi:hypothetical protein